MTHELEQFVYGLDVAEVGVEEANRRWEFKELGWLRARYDALIAAAPTYKEKEDD